MFKLNITKEKLGDFLIMILFDKLFNKEFVNSSEAFNKLKQDLEDKGMKSKIFKSYFDIDIELRTKYRQFSKMILKDRDVAVNIQHNKNTEEK
jgi:hypothetical protein